MDPALFAWCAFALALTCVIWRTSNSYYIVLLGAKYRGVYALEEKLGATPLKDEYAIVQGKRSMARWFSLERAMPLLFIVAYAVFFAVQAGGLEFDSLWVWARELIAGIVTRFGAN